jgi:hypothetical protein
MVKGGEDVGWRARWIPATYLVRASRLQAILSFMLHSLHLLALLLLGTLGETGISPCRASSSAPGLQHHLGSSRGLREQVCDDEAGLHLHLLPHLHPQLDDGGACEETLCCAVLRNWSCCSVAFFSRSVRVASDALPGVQVGMQLFAMWGLYEPKKLSQASVAPLAVSYVAYIVLSNLNLKAKNRTPCKRPHHPSSTFPARPVYPSAWLRALGLANRHQRSAVESASACQTDRQTKGGLGPRQPWRRRRSATANVCLSARPPAR